MGDKELEEEIKFGFFNSLLDLHLSHVRYSRRLQEERPSESTDVEQQQNLLRTWWWSYTF